MLKNPEIIVVSGLPRSGTSLMMQMLEKGGVEVVTDRVRAADADNPRGYYEVEAVKRIRQDASWLPQVRGKALKMVSQLLYDLPGTERYRIVFMERDLDEVLSSQEKMLERRGRPAGPREEMKRAYTSHLARLQEWLCRQAHLAVLRIRYDRLVEHSSEEAERVNAFLGGNLSVQQMADAVAPELYRNKSRPVVQ